MNTEKRLYQWDTGQKLVGCTGLYVDFPIGDEVYRVETADGMCIIPDELLQTSGSHKVYECMTNNTIRSFGFSVKPRPMPPNYVYTPTEKLTLEGLAQRVDDAIADMIRRADSGEFDGYTPVKGVDYFDGVDGKDGKDGHTPVKGVDYFDGEKGDKGDPFTYEDFTPEQLASLKGDKGDKGADGKDGANGKDGKDGQNGADGKDGISATHQWNGTVLTVTSASGTSSADLKGDKGEQGDIGAVGEAGGYYTPTVTQPDESTLRMTFTPSKDGMPDVAHTDITLLGGGNVQPDWNQNDDTQPDYVKNRPFYMGDLVETVLVEESTVSFVDDEGLYVAEFPSTFYATVGETYKISWDGTAYECTCVEMGVDLVIGNLSIYEAGSDTGEPFIIYIANGIYPFINTTDTSDSHTISISGFAQEIVKIPAKFIDKDASGYIVVHNGDTMTKEEAKNYNIALLKGEAVFISWGSVYINEFSVSTATDSTGASIVYLSLRIPNGEIYRIAQNSEGLFSLGDRKLLQANFPAYKANGEKNPAIGIVDNKVKIRPSEFLAGVGTTNTLFSVNANGAKSKNFDVLGNGEAVAPAFILYSSTPNSTKKFRITVDDSGTISANEVT